MLYVRIEAYTPLSITTCSYTHNNTRSQCETSTLLLPAYQILPNLMALVTMIALMNESNKVMKVLVEKVFENTCIDFSECTKDGCMLYCITQLCIQLHCTITCRQREMQLYTQLVWFIGFTEIIQGIHSYN